ncbi:alpha/beta hydrolase [Sutcliffiella horikoshii]|uniref:alpha/beta hydrolase n=1 Tax=Sutcliffiella horikoshii TaxID=79883 RepID=UPI00203C0E75|nr:alpha/beta hydrolase [Sutcliffiella horikoshii]MCM3617497.1 alpha/beta hydrolase [Sutcliffiella horikoshii]
MILENQKSEVKIYPTNLIKQKETTTKLAIILPGAGYTSQGPLLHFSSGHYFNQGFDVLQVNYRFGEAELNPFDAEGFNKNVIHTLEEALKERHYDQYVFIAKSIGTIALPKIIKLQDYKNASAVWLTPLLHRDDVYQAMLQTENNSLCIIGDKDFCYREERFTNLESHSAFKTLLIADGDHSLEDKENVLGSIDMLKHVIDNIIEF